MLVGGRGGKENSRWEEDIESAKKSDNTRKEVD